MVKLLKIFRTSGQSYSRLTFLIHVTFLSSDKLRNALMASVSCSEFLPLHPRQIKRHFSTSRASAFINTKVCVWVCVLSSDKLRNTLLASVSYSEFFATSSETNKKSFFNVTSAPVRLLIRKFVYGCVYICCSYHKSRGLNGFICHFDGDRL